MIRVDANSPIYRSCATQSLHALGTAALLAGIAWMVFSVIANRAFTGLGAWTGLGIASTGVLLNGAGFINHSLLVKKVKEEREKEILKQKEVLDNFQRGFKEIQKQLLKQATELNQKADALSKLADEQFGTTYRCEKAIEKIADLSRKKADWLPNRESVLLHELQPLMEEVSENMRKLRELAIQLRIEADKREKIAKKEETEINEQVLKALQEVAQPLLQQDLRPFQESINKLSKNWDPTIRAMNEKREVLDQAVKDAEKPTRDEFEAYGIALEKRARELVIPQNMSIHRKNLAEKRILQVILWARRLQELKGENSLLSLLEKERDQLLFEINGNLEYLVQGYGCLSPIKKEPEKPKEERVNKEQQAHQKWNDPNRLIEMLGALIRSLGRSRTIEMRKKVREIRVFKRELEGLASDREKFDAAMHNRDFCERLDSAILLIKQLKRSLYEGPPLFKAGLE